MKTFSIQDYYSIGGKEKAGGGGDKKKELSRESLLNSFEKFVYYHNLLIHVVPDLFKLYFGLTKFNIFIQEMQQWGHIFWMREFRSKNNFLYLNWFIPFNI